MTYVQDRATKLAHAKRKAAKIRAVMADKGIIKCFVFFSNSVYGDACAQEATMALKGLDIAMYSLYQDLVDAGAPDLAKRVLMANS